MELHSKDFESKKDYHQTRKQLVSVGHELLYHDNKKAVFKSNAIHLNACPAYLQLSNPLLSNEIKKMWVVVKSNDCYKIIQTNEYSELFNNTEYGTVIFAEDNKSFTVYLN